MAGSMPVRVAILYLHPLLGEGLARLLEAESGIAAAAIAAGDEIGTATALGSEPDVVIVERGRVTDSSDIAGNGSGPILLYVGIGGPGGSPPAGALDDDLERVVRAVRDLKLERMSLVSV